MDTKLPKQTLLDISSTCVHRWFTWNLQESCHCWHFGTILHSHLQITNFQFVATATYLIVANLRLSLYATELFNWNWSHPSVDGSIQRKIGRQVKITVWLANLFTHFTHNRISRSQLNAVVSNDPTKKEDKYDLCKRANNVLLVENLCKTYKGNHQALDNVSFNIGSGEVSIGKLLLFLKSCNWRFNWF